MPKYAIDHVPTYRLHKQSGQAVVTLSGQDYLLGKHRSPESRAEYGRLLAEWELNGRQPPVKSLAAVTVSIIIARFWALRRA